LTDLTVAYNAAMPRRLDWVDSPKFQGLRLLWLWLEV
jgi:hypothetical protein